MNSADELNEFLEERSKMEHLKPEDLPSNINPNYNKWRVNERQPAATNDMKRIECILQGISDKLAVNNIRQEQILARLDALKDHTCGNFDRIIDRIDRG